MNLYKNITKLLLVLAVSLPATLAAETAIVIHDAWINQAPPGTDVTAGYCMIHNTGTTEVKLIQVTSPDFGRVEMHRSIVSDGIARMVAQDSITIPGNGGLTLKPGDYHLMLFKPNKLLVAGDTVTLSYRFSDATSIEVIATVRQPEAGQEDHSQHH